MNRRHALIAVPLLLPGPLLAAEFQYATFSETEIQPKNREVAIILSFNTDPGTPITVMESSPNPLKARQVAYENFYKRMGWADATELDPLYVLNRLGKHGWEVIHVRKAKGTAFVTKDPSNEEEYFLKKTK